MEPDVQRHLQQLTADFYRSHARSFDESRKGAWDSWSILLENLMPFASILDLGCGNGRFAGFLSENITDFAYTGIDTEPTFIEAAKQRHPQHTFATQDLHEPLEVNAFDAVVSFGVLHHVPGFTERIALLERLATALRPGGKLALSLWQPRLLKNFEAKVSTEHRIDGLEKNDFLLGWKGSFEHVRYCHHFDDAEIDDLIASSPLHLVQQFQGTGNDETNRYVILGKKATSLPPLP